MRLRTTEIEGDRDAPPEMRFVLHKEAVTKNYTASSRLSIAYLFVIACNIFALVVPFYFWNVSDGFWITEGSYREQPDVSFLYKVIMVLTTTSATTGQPSEIFVSTFNDANELRHDTFRMANIQSHEGDQDLDGIFDWFDLEVKVPLHEGEEVKSMQAIAFFDYQLTKRVKLGMESIAYASVDSAVPLSGYDTEGDLLFRQASPLEVRGYKSTLYVNETPLVRSDSQLASNSNIGDILSRFRIRNIAADFVERYPVRKIDLSVQHARSFDLKMKIRIPQQEIVRYIPTLLEILKDAWVKYLSVVILCWLLLDRLKTFAFGHHFV